MIELLARLKDWNYLRKWLVLGALIGVVAGLGALAFIFALEGASKLLLETLGGYEPPLPFGEGNRLAAGSFAALGHPAGYRTRRPDLRCAGLPLRPGGRGARNRRRNCRHPPQSAVFVPG